MYMSVVSSEKVPKHLDQVRPDISYKMKYTNGSTCHWYL